MPQSDTISPSDTKALRTVLGCYATGVAIVTTHSPADGLIGVTINSFSSVSLEPPLILFSLSRSSNMLGSFQEAGSFVVNILAFGQKELSNMFAKPSTASWAQTRYIQNAQGCALLRESLAHMECTKTAEIDGGDHVIFLLRVDLFHLRESADPLLFYRGRYGTYVCERLGKLSPADSALSDFSVSGWG